MNKRKNFDRKRWLVRYETYLNDARGLSKSTQRVYILIATRFLESLSEQGRWIKWSQLTAPAVVRFVRSESSFRTGRGPGTIVYATRSFLRFLVSQGVLAGGIEAAVPTIRSYRHSTLPCYFAEADIVRILKATKGDVRKYAILVLLARLGLRIDEIANLRLDDIDWINGCVVIRAGKNRRERKLPLAQDLAETLLNYLRRARPRVDDRHVFLHLKPPHNAYEGSALGKVVNRLLAKFGMSGGSHRFRHSAATQMVNRGATFKSCHFAR